MADEEIPQEESQEPAPPPLPPVRCVAEDYDANNQEHFAQWVLSGKPDPTGWQCTFYEDLQEDGETYVRRPQPQPLEPDPLTDFERGASRMAERREVRNDTIFSPSAGLVGTCYAWLQRPCAVPGEQAPQSKSPSAALAAGQGLCELYATELLAWINFGVQAFYNAMSSPDAARPWLEWIPAGEPKSIREAILDRIYLASFGVARPWAKPGQKNQIREFGP